MSYSLSKPIYDYESHLRYIRHRQALSNITSVGLENSPEKTSASFKKMHQQSAAYQQSTEEKHLFKENKKIYQRLVEMSHKSGVDCWNRRAKGRIVSFNNPARKMYWVFYMRRERVISESNNQLAIRLITNRSRFDHSIVKRDIQQYEKLKKTLYNNRKALLNSRFKTQALDSASCSRYSMSLANRRDRGSTLNLGVSKTRFSSMWAWVYILCIYYHCWWGGSCSIMSICWA